MFKFIIVSVIGLSLVGCASSTGVRTDELDQIMRYKDTVEGVYGWVSFLGDKVLSTKIQSDKFFTEHMQKLEDLVIKAWDNYKKGGSLKDIDMYEQFWKEYTKVMSYLKDVIEQYFISNPTGVGSE